MWYLNYISDLGNPHFSMMQDRSENGIPLINIRFQDGYEDTLILHKHTSQMRTDDLESEYCHYLGHLENEPEACIAVTGCHDREDLEFTIISSHSTKSNMFVWARDGTVKSLNTDLSKV